MRSCAEGSQRQEVENAAENHGRSCSLVLVNFPHSSITGAVDTDEDVSLAWLCHTLQSCTGVSEQLWILF